MRFLYQAIEVFVRFILSVRGGMFAAVFSVTATCSGVASVSTKSSAVPSV